MIYPKENPIGTFGNGLDVIFCSELTFVYKALLFRLLVYWLIVFSVSQWEDPGDETVFCVKPDGNNAIVVGTARHGLVRLWDKRLAGASAEPVQVVHGGPEVCIRDSFMCIWLIIVCCPDSSNLWIMIVEIR